MLKYTAQDPVPALDEICVDVVSIQKSLAFWWVCFGCGRWSQVVEVTKHSGMLFKRGVTSEVFER